LPSRFCHLDALSQIDRGAIKFETGGKLLLIEEEEEAWQDDFFKDDEEWEKMSIWEQRGIQRPDLSQEEIDARVKSIMNSSGSIKLEGDLGLEIAMSAYGTKLFLLTDVVPPPIVFEVPYVFGFVE